MRTYANIEHFEHKLGIKNQYNNIVNVFKLPKYRTTIDKRVMKGYSILVGDRFYYFSSDIRDIEDYIYYLIKPWRHLSYKIKYSVYVAKFDYKTEKDITTIYYSNRTMTQNEIKKGKEER